MAHPAGSSRLEAIARSTVEAIDKGFYINNEGKRIPIQPSNSILYTPKMLEALVKGLGPATIQFQTEIVHTLETTLQACRREAQKDGDILALNFASGTRPGGGFLRGAQAQEESIARSSSLYDSLLKHPEYYNANKNVGAPFYTDHMILSRGVLVFREDSGNWLTDPYMVSILTVPAPNCSAGENPLNYSVEKTLRDRAVNICAVAWSQGYTTLILGAWGCGVFQNDARTVAEAFKAALKLYPFKKVVFAIYGGDKHIPIVFKEVLK